MKMKSVTSTNIQEIGHDPKTNTLAIRFKDGGLYHYEGVEAKAAEAMMGAKSVGSHFHAHIKGKHAHKRQDERK